jgi:hypothetical protein
MDGQLSRVEVKKNMAKKYLVNKGYSQSTRKGIAHAGGTITADLLTIDNAEEFLDLQVEKGKFTVIEEAEPEKKQLVEDVVEKEAEPEKKEESEESSKNNNKIFKSGGARRK